MREISIKSVKDGMVLAEPLENAHGSLLLGKGSVLTEVFAARLAQRGILTVWVEGEPEKKASTIQLSEIQKIPLEKLFEKLFEGRIVNDSMNIIYEALVRHRNSNG